MAEIPIEVHLGPDDLARDLVVDVARGLTHTPKVLPPKWFYDETGCEIFDKITRLPEYYPTEREREILGRESELIARMSEADTLVELGSGTSDKTRTLLDAFTGTGQLRRFVAFDISEPTLRASCAAIADEYAGIDVQGVVGDFERHLANIPGDGRRMVAFLGGTIGNLEPTQRQRFLTELAGALRPGEALLLGTDLVKETHRLVDAYDDAAGVTAEFNLNVLRVVNRELGADFDLDRFEHVALFDQQQEWIEMRLRSSAAQKVVIAELGMVVEFAEGEEMRTEISAKFRREGVEHELLDAGLEPAAWMTDSAGDFGLSLSFRQ